MQEHCHVPRVIIFCQKYNNYAALYKTFLNSLGKELGFVYVLQYCILRIIRPQCIICPPPSSAESYVEGYLYIYSIRPPSTTYCTGNNDSRQVTNFSHVDGFENSRFWHSSLDRQLRLLIGKFSLQK